MGGAPIRGRGGGMGRGGKGIPEVEGRLKKLFSSGFDAGGGGNATRKKYGLYTIVLA